MTNPVIEMPVIESPCVDICELMPNGVCSGCFRSTQEIGQWLMYSDEERRTIMADLPNRRDDLFSSTD